MKFKKGFKNLLKILIILAVLTAVSVFAVNKTVIAKTQSFIYSTTENIPENKVGLLLGTSKFLSNGNINLYYKYRIDAAVELYNAHKINYIVISGDNSRKDYDEPTMMKNDLISLGVPAEKIYLDYAGFRTLDSVVRMKDIFGQQSFTVISQQFHNERAIYIARNKGLEATGFNAKDVDKYYGFKTNMREKFARVKMLIDLTFDKKPKFGGEKIEIK